MGLEYQIGLLGPDGQIRSVSELTLKDEGVEGIEGLFKVPLCAPVEGLLGMCRQLDLQRFVLLM